MRKKKAIFNFASTLVLNFFLVTIGFIVPKALIVGFGSEIYGIVSSVKQFLHYITLLESGVGGVIVSQLYKPLAYKDNVKISSIVNASRSFFKKIAYLYLLYTIILLFIFPYIQSSSVDNRIISLIILSLSFNTFVDYYFSISYNLLLQASQKTYIVNVSRLVSTLVSSFATILLIELQFPVYIVLFVSSIALVIRPILIYFYIKMNYSLDKNVIFNLKTINEKWYGLGHHFAYFTKQNSDIFIITLVLGFNEVAVYSIYFMVITGLKRIIESLSTGVKAAFGDMIAKADVVVLSNRLKHYQLLMFILLSILLALFFYSIEPFIAIYTKGITDVNYIRRSFAIVLLSAEAIYSIGTIYVSVVLAAGFFKSTLKYVLIESILNICVSIVITINYGLVGVALGTLFGSLYRLITFFTFLHNNIISIDLKFFFKLAILSTAFVIVCPIILSNLINIKVNTYLLLFTNLLFASLIVIIASFLYYYVFFKTDFIELYKLILSFKKVEKKNAG